MVFARTYLRFYYRSKSELFNNTQYWCVSRRMFYLLSCNILPFLCVELNTVQSVYTPPCNICVTDTTFNVVRPLGLVVMFHHVKLPFFVGERSGIVARL